MHITYDGDKKCSLTHDDSGAVIRSDAPKDIGGSGSSFSPTDLVGAALGGCIATTMAMFAERHEIDLTGLRVHVTKEMTKTTPRRIGALKATVTIPTGRVPESQRDALERVGENCPVYKSLHPDIETPIEFIYED